MSFQNSSFLLRYGSTSLADGQMQFETSVRMDQKRGHRWLMGASEQELFLNKKQAIDPDQGTLEPGFINSSLWHNVSGSQTGYPANNQLFCPKLLRSPYISDKSNPSASPTLVNVEKISFQNQFGSSSNCASMPQAMDDTGRREVELKKVSVSDDCSPEFVGNSFYPREKDKLMNAADPSTAISMIPVSTYNSDNGISLPVNPSLCKMDKSLISDEYNGGLMLTHQLYSRILNNAQSVGQAFIRGSSNVNSFGEQYAKDGSCFMPISGSGHENLFSKYSFYNKMNEEVFTSAGSSYDAGDRSIAIYGQQDAAAVSLGGLVSKENSNIPSQVENCRKGKQTITTISFGASQDDPRDRNHLAELTNSYHVVLNQSTEDLSANVISATSRAQKEPKNKEKTVKQSPTNFPTNVKSLLSTGILDGVPVKYVSWSREKNLRGMVKGMGYLCGCQDCNLTRVVNAYEFERHADCKTKHPNNHIYFENGKTIYAVVQELKSTPQEVLFEAMETVTGSPINQKNFSTWKASYQAATRELHRIYGREEVAVQS
ncbi:uncharacterized protein LOC127243177 [Andrographis paniculata]|uniref:uncharacterized protein LOC127243177 n=1 Tax=Andrographis paniculata TaxID=175694 RepID=UPI0021E7F8A3|nr:uncharacterized protein LOC127243177 [Andrographis paniculata]